MAKNLEIWTLGLAGRSADSLRVAVSRVPSAIAVDVRFNPNWPLPRSPRKLTELLKPVPYETWRGLGNKLHKLGGYELAVPSDLDRLEFRVREGERFIVVCQCRCSNHCAKVAIDGVTRCAAACHDRCSCERRCHRYVLVTDELAWRIPGLRVIDL